MDPFAIRHTLEHLGSAISALDEKLDAILGVINAQRKDLIDMANDEKAALAALQDQVTANTTVEGSALALIQGFSARLDAAVAAASAGDPAALSNLQSALKTSADALSAAVAANTPAAPPATGTP